MKKITKEKLQKIRENKKVRKRLAYEDPLWFSLLYLQNSQSHFSYRLAPFHLEMFHIIRDATHEYVVVVAFRGSGKSTIMNMANILWSILGKPQKKFVIIIGKTQEQAKNHFANVKAELESNELLRRDFGPFIESQDKWKKLSLELVYRESKILSVAVEQDLRGLKHGVYRPDLIICDDIEDNYCAADYEKREAFVKRCENEILPLGDENTRIVILGNAYSEKSFVDNLKERIYQEDISGIFRLYPILDSGGRPLWPSKHPGARSIDKIRRSCSRESWIEEYMLNTRDYIEYRKSSVLTDEDIEKENIELEKLRKEYDYPAPPDQSQVALIKQMERFRIADPLGRVGYSISGYVNWNDDRFKEFIGKYAKMSGDIMRDRIRANLVKKIMEERGIEVEPPSWC